MIRHNFCRSDGRLVKLFLFSTLLHKSPLTCTYFATFEKKREVRSPLTTQPNFLVFGIYIYIYDAYVLICVLSNANFDVQYLSLGKRFLPEILRVF